MFFYSSVDSCSLEVIHCVFWLVFNGYLIVLNSIFIPPQSCQYFSPQRIVNIILSVQPNSLRIVPTSILKLVQLVMKHSSVPVHPRVIRIDFLRPVIILTRLFDFLQVCVDLRPVAVHLCVSAVDPDRLRVVLNSSLVLLQSSMGLASVVEGFCAVWFELDDSVVVLDCEFVLFRGGVCHCPVEVRLRQKGVQFQSLRVVSYGLPVFSHLAVGLSPGQEGVIADVYIGVLLGVLLSFFGRFFGAVLYVTFAGLVGVVCGVCICVENRAFFVLRVFAGVVQDGVS